MAVKTFFLQRFCRPLTLRKLPLRRFESRLKQNWELTWVIGKPSLISIGIWLFVTVGSDSIIEFPSLFLIQKLINISLTGYDVFLRCCHTSCKFMLKICIIYLA